MRLFVYLLVLVGALGGHGAAFELVVFGGTPAGVSAAISAADKGVSAVLISQTETVGGAISNGLGAQDIGSSTYAKTGFQKKFFDAVAAHYGVKGQRNVGPAAAEAIFTDMLDAAGVTIVRNATLLSVAVTGRTINSITTDQGSYAAPHFVDASYPADLTAMAGAPFRLGYEDAYYYNEPYARSRAFKTAAALIAADRAGADAAFSANPFITSFPAMPFYENASALGMPSMTFRLSVSTAADRIPFAATANYETYAESWRRYFRAFFLTNSAATTTNTNGSILNALFHIARVSGDKWDLNQGSSSFLNVPIPRVYFEGTPAQRQAVLDQLEDYMRNFLRFAQVDPSIPAEIRDTIIPFGLSPDEFMTHGNWPREAYIREGRRIVGRDTLTSFDIYDVGAREAADTIAIGAYKMDSKPSLVAYADGVVSRDGSPYLRTPYYEIPLGALLPIGLDNLIVPVGISASPTAYGSVRMEPQYMAMGEAAGVVSYIAKLKGTTIAEAAKKWYPSIRYILTNEKQRNAVISIRSLCALVGAASRAKVGFDPTTCVPVAFDLSD